MNYRPNVLPDFPLAPGERVLVDAEFSRFWLIAWCIVAVILLAPSLVGIPVAISNGAGPIAPMLGGFALLAVLFALPALISRQIHKNKKLVITDRRVILAQGILSRNLTALPRDKVAGIDVRTGIVSFLGGTVSVSTGASVIKLHGVKNPTAIQYTLASDAI